MLNSNDLLYQQAFELFDKDGDGRISAEELLDAMTTITGTMAIEEANELMKEADTDGNGFIDYKGMHNSTTSFPE